MRTTPVEWCPPPAAETQESSHGDRSRDTGEPTPHAAGGEDRTGDGLPAHRRRENRRSPSFAAAIRRLCKRSRTDAMSKNTKSRAITVPHQPSLSMRAP